MRKVYLSFTCILLCGVIEYVFNAYRPSGQSLVWSLSVSLLLTLTIFISGLKIAGKIKRSQLWEYFGVMLVGFIVIIIFHYNIELLSKA